MAYYQIGYFIYFLAAALLFYQIFPKKLRYLVLLVFSGFYVLYYSSVQAFCFTLATGAITYACGMLLSRMKKNGESKLKGMEKEEKKLEKKKQKSAQKLVLVLSVLMVLGVLLYLKYYNFFAENLNHLFGGREILRLKHLLMPLGISFYTLSAVGYMADVYWEKVEAQKNPLKLLLFLMFFPTIMEGPIMPYSEVKNELFAGEPLDPDNLSKGYIRIFWGLFKKLIIADRLYLVVTELFNNYEGYHGAYIPAAAITYTVQLYMEFSGCIDIVIGTARLFGITLPENFRQPFMAKDASEFWRRWHISLGVWFKSYIFYPVSMSRPAKKWNKYGAKHAGKYLTHVVASAMALLPVWLANGLWHGARWSYICYGIYYFFFILLEIVLEPVRTKALESLHISDETNWYLWIRRAKTWCIIFFGELFFRADSLGQGLKMLKSAGRGFSLSALFDGTLLSMGLDSWDWWAVAVGLLIVGAVGALRERHEQLGIYLAERKLPLRWAVYICLIVAVMMFGVYGPGHEEVDMIYAGF